MFRNIRDSIINFITSRFFILILAFMLMCGILIRQLFVLQIVNGESYLNEFTLKIRKERTIPSTRGQIFDRNGELLAYNELAYSVTIEDVYESGRGKNKAVNTTLASLIEMVESNGDSVVSDFNIIIGDNGEFEFAVSGTTLQRFLADVYGRTYIDDLSYAEKPPQPKRLSIIWAALKNSKWESMRILMTEVRILSSEKDIPRMSS